MWNLSYWRIKWLNAFSISWRRAWDFLVWEQKRLILICWLLTIGRNRVERWLLVVENGLKWRWQSIENLSWKLVEPSTHVEMWLKFSRNCVEIWLIVQRAVEMVSKTRWNHVEKTLKIRWSSTLKKALNAQRWTSWKFFSLFNVEASTVFQRWFNVERACWDIKTKIGSEIKHFQVAKCKLFIGKAGMQSPKNKFRFKKDLKLSIL